MNFIKRNNRPIREDLEQKSVRELLEAVSTKKPESSTSAVLPAYRKLKN